MSTHQQTNKCVFEKRFWPNVINSKVLLKLFKELHKNGGMLPGKKDESEELTFSLKARLAIRLPVLKTMGK